MKKVLMLTLMALLVLPAMSQNKKYKKAMLAAIEQMNKATDPLSELEIAASFEEIALNFPDQWLPSYHAGRVIVTSSFAEGDPDTKDAMLDRAKKSLDMALEIVPEESEVQVLKALYFIGMMSVDPMTRGQLYYEDAMVAIEQSETLNPENPRAWFLDGMMTVNMPEFMGGGPEAARPIFTKAAEKFKTFTNEDPLWPTWGEDLNQAELDKLK